MQAAADPPIPSSRGSGHPHIGLPISPCRGAHPPRPETRPHRFLGARLTRQFIPRHGAHPPWQETRPHQFLGARLTRSSISLPPLLAPF